MTTSSLCRRCTGRMRKPWWVLAMLTLVVMHVGGCAAPLPPAPLQKCVGFEGLKVGAKYKVGATFVDSGARIEVSKFYWSNGKPTSDGRAEVMNVGLAGGSGNEMFLNNVNLGFDVGSLQCITLRFRDRGGNVNLLLNGQKGNFQDFQDGTVGGVKVTVAYDAGKERKGTLKLTGKFTPFQLGESMISFAIGGQELSIDDVCPCQ